MNILVTGAKGFVGKNLCAQLKNIKDGKDRTHPELTINEIFEYDLDSTPKQLEEYCQKADFVFNLAGVNRPKEQSEFMTGNFGFASTLLDTLKKHKNACPVMLSSSQQASLTGRFGNSEYGKSKLAGEELFFDYAKETGAKVLVYRFPNLFGKWCRPNYNSAVATFCNNMAHDLPIQVNDPSVELELLYIDDLVEEMLLTLSGNEHHCEFDGLKVIPDNQSSVVSHESLGGSCDSSVVSRESLEDTKDQRPKTKDLSLNQSSAISLESSEETKGQRPKTKDAIGRYCYVPTTYFATLGEIMELLNSFKAQPETLMMPEIPAGSFAKKLYSTYLSYLPKEKVSFPIKMNIDPRGSFTELLRTKNCGQVSVNISKPGITKGQHWHNSKWEFFIVVSGHGLIQERSLSQPSPQERTLEEPYHTADPALYGALKEKAENMRKNPTEAESALWNILRNKNMDTKFRRQHIIGDYIVDFVNLETQLIIEVDGEYHHQPEQIQLDEERTKFLQQKGFAVLRFSNDEVLCNTDATFNIINNALTYLKSSLEGEIQRRQILNFFVSGDKIEIVQMLPGYTHNIINLSETENLVTVMWANESFDPQKPDTFFEPV